MDPTVTPALVGRVQGLGRVATGEQELLRDGHFCRIIAGYYQWGPDLCEEVWRRC